jgi:uncharacterized protein
MSRLIFLFAIAAVVYLLIKSLRNSVPEKKPGAAENMVCCAHCGVHLPDSESVRTAGRSYCSAAHAALHEADRT